MMAAKLEDFARHRESRWHEAAPRDQARRTGRGCPICGALPSGRYRPFCSARCADIDLARWLNESYRVPGDTAERPVEPDNADRTDD
jgi:endogenous inhibitor of DNA gyrase (YacG/DUF329 family)